MKRIALNDPQSPSARERLPALEGAPTDISSARGASPPSVIRTFGDYELLGELGRGGMGIVYKAKQRALGRLVALKVLTSGRTATLIELKRFETEILAAGKLQHPNIVRVHAAGQVGQESFYSMEFVEGSNLERNLQEGRAGRDPRWTATLVAKVARALDYAHRQGVVHRDLKPPNILFDERGEPRVADFGLAKVMDSDLEVTRAGDVFGTPLYMSPEQVSGESKFLDGRSDIFSLGTILYRMLTGRHPFSGGNLHEIFDRIANTSPPPPRSIVPEVPPPLEAICLKALEKEPSRRYQTAGEFAADLERWLNEEPIHAVPPSFASRQIRRLRRHGLKFVFPAVVVVVVLAVWALLSFMPSNSGDSSPAEDGADREREARDALASGARHLDVGDAAGAALAFEAALFAAPDDRLRAEAHAGLARARLALVELDRALEDARRAVELAPGWTPAILVRGRVLARLGRHREAVADLRRAAQEMRDDLEIHLDLAANSIALAAGPDRSDEDARTASAALVRAADLSPSGDARPHYLRGALLLATGDAEGAKKSYDRALTADPN
ncbi:MAG: protein kinase, partial [Planctomycetes bacterium]|nr:protein kinase [Planctomycetota bacterium]